MEIASLGFRTDLAVLALGGSEVVAHDDYVTVTTAENPDYWWGNFILLASPPAAGEAAMLRARFHRHLPSARHLAFGIDSTDGQPGNAATRRALALAADVQLVLAVAADQLAPPDPLPATFAVRELSGDLDWDALGRLQSICSELPDTPEYRAHAAAKLRASRRICEQGDGFWLGAFAGELLAAALGVVRTDANTARYQDVETDPQLRRRGLASALVRAAGLRARERFASDRLVIVADPSYHAVRIYERAGFTVRERQCQLTRPPRPSVRSYRGTRSRGLASPGLTSPVS